MSKLLRNASTLGGFPGATRGSVDKSIVPGTQKIDVLTEERELIQQIFNIVDKDNSGNVDAPELLKMFEMFGENTGVLKDALDRIMGKFDGDMDGQISPAEFYFLLSQRFKPDSPDAEIEKVFAQICPSGELSAKDLFDVGKKLGEDIPMTECADMVKTFNAKYQKDLKEYMQKKGTGQDTATKPASPRACSKEDFIKVMKEPLDADEGDVQ
mmetsp:Transcript_23392/g.53984  ORF Transcript_23392/g.53984 Transcript_23392/m.53984 type:complete len:212 (+) Transcript_23392:81-716(+)